MKNKLLTNIRMLLLLSSITSKAQWQSINLTKEQNFVQAFAAHKNYLFMGINSGGIFRSEDQGLSWQLVNNGININAGTFIPSIIICEDQVYALVRDKSSSRVYSSNDNGKTWNLYSGGLVNESGNTVDVVKLFVLNDYIYAASPEGLYVASNSKSGWNKTNFPVLNDKTEVVAITEKGNVLFVSTVMEGVFSSVDNGGTWKKASNHGLEYEGNVMTLNFLVQNKNYLLGGTEQGLFISYNNGESWEKRMAGPVRSLITRDAKIYLGNLDREVLCSDDDGLTWKQEGLGLNLVPTSLAFMEDELYAANNGAGIYKHGNVPPAIKSSSNVSFVNSRLKVYPTAVTSLCSVFFDLSEDNNIEISVYNGLGQKLQVQNLQGAKGYQVHSLNLETLNNGVYFIGLTVDKITTTEKIIINK